MPMTRATFYDLEILIIIMIKFINNNNDQIH